MNSDITNGAATNIASNVDNLVLLIAAGRTLSAAALTPSFLNLAAHAGVRAMISPKASHL
jgi:hypothetical protein